MSGDDNKKNQCQEPLIFDDDVAIDGSLFVKEDIYVNNDIYVKGSIHIGNAAEKLPEVVAGFHTFDANATINGAIGNFLLTYDNAILEKNVKFDKAFVENHLGKQLRFTLLNIPIGFPAHFNLTSPYLTKPGDATVTTVSANVSGPSAVIVIDILKTNQGPFVSVLAPQAVLNPSSI